MIRAARGLDLSESTSQKTRADRDLHAIQNSSFVLFVVLDRGFENGDGDRFAEDDADVTKAFTHPETLRSAAR